MILDKVRRTWARILSPRRLHERRAIGTLSITFDDFPKTAWTEGGRVLRDNGVRATYYVCGALCGGMFDGLRMCDAEDLQPIHAEGHEIGCHTFEHRSCLRTSLADFERSTEDNLKFVQQRLGEVRFSSFAYPYGDATTAAKRMAVRRFASARGVNQGLNSGRIDLGQLRAVGFEAGKRSIEAVHAYVRRAAERGAWLIIYTHDVQDRPSHFGCRPADLDRLVRLAKESGLEILPVKAALAARAFAPPRP